ncbi:MAG TPA: molecular chaperone TorD family protein [Acidobacteriota bacterium]
MAQLSAESELRCWAYRTIAQLLDEIPERLPPLGAATGQGMIDPEAGQRYSGTRTAAENLQRAFAAQTREGIQADQTRLLINAPGGVLAPPYASWYLDGALQGPSCDWVAQEYGSQALEPDAEGGEPADFLATELEYMYFLCRHERAARLTADAAALAAVEQAQARFLNHLSRWLPRFLSRLRAGRPRGVYRALADLLEVFLNEELERVKPTLDASAAGASGSPSSVG